MPDHSDLGFVESPHADLGFVASDAPPKPAQEEPGIVRKALTWATTPFKVYEPMLAERRKLAGEVPGIIGKDSPDWLTAAGQFVAGMPGFQGGSADAEARLAQYGKENPKTTMALRLLGGMASPVLPRVEALTQSAPQSAANVLRRAAESTLTPTPEALFLRSKGVPLTVGQLNPRSAVGQVEEASTSLRGVGPSIAAQREAGKKGWQQLVMGEAHPPGMPQVPPDWKPADALSAIYEGFKPSYQGVKNELIYPAIHDAAGGLPLQSTGNKAGALQLAALDPSVLATDQTRQMVHNFLQNQLTILPERAGAVGKVGVGDLLQVRSNIRDAIREAVQHQDPASARLLGNGEQAITKAIESQATPGIVDALRQTDAKYHAYKVVEDAVARSADSPSGFSPSQLTAAIRAGTGKSAFARGAGGDLRDLSQAGKSVFESVSPPTGARLLTVGPLGEYGTGPLTFLMNKAPKAPPAQSVNPAGNGAIDAALLRAILSSSRRSVPPTYEASFAQDQQ